MRFGKASVLLCCAIISPASALAIGQADAAHPVSDAAQEAKLAACPPPGYTSEQLLQLRDRGFRLDDPAERNALALGLTACTGEEDPRIRDGVGFEALATWLRAEALAADTVLALCAELRDQLKDAPDAGGFRQPFAALILSEVVRTDRIRPSFTPELRSELAAAAADYLGGVRDYRGYSETEGWRHGVAHGADLALQLALNPQVGADELRKLVGAVFSQVAPRGEVFYVYGEPARLARAAYYAWQRGVLPQAQWQAFFARLADPSPHGSWGEAYSSQAGLAKRHNTQAFLQALHFGAVTSGEESDRQLAAMVMEALAAVQ